MWKQTCLFCYLVEWIVKTVVLTLVKLVMSKYSIESILMIRHIIPFCEVFFPPAKSKDYEHRTECSIAPFSHRYI